MKARSAIIALVICCVGMSVAVRAQGPRRMTAGSGPMAGNNTTSDTATDPIEQAVWKAASQLGLTSDQRSQLTASLKAARADRSAFNNVLQDARRALADALANGETYLDSYIENLASANAKVQESDLKLWAKLYAVLTPDQQRRMLNMATPLSSATGSQQATPNSLNR